MKTVYNGRDGLGIVPEFVQMMIQQNYSSLLYKLHFLRTHWKQNSQEFCSFWQDLYNKALVLIRLAKYISGVEQKNNKKQKV